MSEQIEGLLTQKPSSPAPQVGQVKRFSVQQRTSKAGKPWNKVKAEGEGYGQPYEVKAVKKTDFVDAHGNVSFNVTLVPSNGAAPAPQAATPQAAPRQQSNGNGASHAAPKLSLGDYMSKSATLLEMSHNRAKSMLGAIYTPEDGRTLFIQAVRDGMLSQVPLTGESSNTEDEEELNIP